MQNNWLQTKSQVELEENLKSMVYFDNLNGVMLYHVKLFCFEVFIENGM
jgi:hypothetical protein